MPSMTERVILGLSNSLWNPVLELLSQFSASSPTNVNATSVDDDAEIFSFLSAVPMTCILLIGSGLAVYLLRLLYQHLFQPLDRVRRLGSIGYLNHESGDVSRKELVNLLRKRRKLGDNLPPIYPNGWFRLVDSVQLRIKEVKQVHALGQNFAVFRGESGRVRVMDAYCPHMGGNLAAGGRVKGDCIECPFHGWVYNADGKCVDIPYAKKIPDFAKVKVWHSCEVNGVIFVWYHCDNIEPEWEIPIVPEIKKGIFHYRGRVEHHANTHIQDIPENGSDVAHLSHLHVPSVFCGVNLAEQFDSWFNIADHIFKIKCKGSDSDKPHVSNFSMIHYIHLFRKWKILNLTIEVEQIGPGIVHLHMNLPWGRSVLIQTLTPVGPLHQILIHGFYTDWASPTWLSKILLLFEAIQVDRDVMVWNNKTFSARPMLVKEDAQIAKYRRWFSQFYSENSPRIQLNKGEQENDW